MAHVVVKVIFLCPENHKHTLGAIGRQVTAVPQSPAGSESVVDVKAGLRIHTSDAGARTLIAECRTCRARGSRRSMQLSWARVQQLLDLAEATPDGVLVTPLRV